MVVDEFHHAVTDGYRKLMGYFRPRFLLGLTATPERMNNRDVFILCNYNVPYEIGISDAIRYGCLVPFSNYGISDGVDYGNLRIQNGRYVEEDLDRALINDRRASLIVGNYRRFDSRRALAFCSSVKHALFMRGCFNDAGIGSRAIVSGEGSDDRRLSVEELEKGEVSVLFTADMFNEGVDIPSVDMVMFLRPTESPVVFTQQLGRGLRTCEGKERLTVLDFIGNYHNVDRLPSLLYGSMEGSSKGERTRMVPPYGCTVNFDLEAMGIIERMRRSKRKMNDIQDEEFDRVCDMLNKVPTRVELFSYMDPSLIKMARSKDDMLKDYIGYLIRRNHYDSLRTSLYDKVAGEFIRMLETTSMSRCTRCP